MYQNNNIRCVIKLCVFLVFTTAANLRNHETSHKFKELMSKTEGEDGKDQANNFFQFRKKRTFEWVDGKLKCGFCDKCKF